MNELIAKLNKALRPRSDSNQGSTRMRHENEAAILEAATKMLSKSSTGAELLRYAQDTGVTIAVLRGVEKFGYFVDKSMAYISCPAGQSMPTVRAVIHLAGALRQAMLERTPLKSPDIRAGEAAYVKTQMDRATDIVKWQTEVVYQLFQATGLGEIIDEFSQMGYLSVYEVYKRDLESNASGV